jgi:hypothetical protein
MAQSVKDAIDALVRHERQFAISPYASDVESKAARMNRPDREITAIMSICDRMQRLTTAEDAKEFEELWQQLVELNAGTAPTALKAAVSDAFLSDEQMRARKL